MQRLTLAEWDAMRLGIMDDLPEERGYNWRFLESHRKMRKQYGPRPRPKGGHMDPWTLRKSIYAAIAGLVALGPVLNVVGEGGIDGPETISLVTAFAIAALSKYSNPEKAISPKPTVKG